MFAQLKGQTLWITRLITSSPKLVTCDRCRAAEDWRSTRPRRGPPPAPVAWKAQGPAVVSAAGELIAFVPGSTETTAAELARFPELLSLLQRIAQGESVGKAEAAALLASMPTRVEGREGGSEIRGDYVTKRIHRANRARGEIVTKLREDPTTPEGRVEVAASAIDDDTERDAPLPRA